MIFSMEVKLPVPNWPKQNPATMNAFYGNPDANRDFRPDPAWEAANIVKLTPPYTLYYPESVHGVIQKRAKTISALRVHKKCKNSLESALRQIKQNFTAQDIKDYELDLCAGVHVFRLKVGGSTLSIHSWGAAIDLSHLINGWKKTYDPDPRKRMMPTKVVDIFDSEGWTWGGLWRNADAMHFQAADI